MCQHRTYVPCEKDHIVIGREILQHGLTEDIAECTLGKNWSVLCCSLLGLKQDRKKIKCKLLQETKNMVENPSL